MSSKFLSANMSVMHTNTPKGLPQYLRESPPTHVSHASFFQGRQDYHFAITQLKSEGATSHG